MRNAKRDDGKFRSDLKNVSCLDPRTFQTGTLVWNRYARSIARQNHKKIRDARFFFGLNTLNDALHYVWKASENLHYLEVYTPT